MRASSATLTKIVPPTVVIMLLIAIWWILVVRNDSAIFPTPWQVVTGAWDLARAGTLWQHIGASLFRVGIGFGQTSGQRLHGLLAQGQLPAQLFLLRQQGRRCHCPAFIFGI